MIRLSVFVVTSLILVACLQPVVTDSPRGSIALTLTDGNEQRNLVPFPYVDMSVAAYDLTGTGPSGATLSAFNVSGTYTGTLQVGDWSIHASGKNAMGTVIVEGTVTVTIVANSQTSATLNCFPIAGNGTLNLDISWPAGSITTPLVIATLTPAGATGSPLTFVTGSTSATWTSSTLASGFYQLSVVLQDNSTVPAKTLWGHADSVQLLAGKVTSGNWVLTQSVLNGALAVTGVGLNKVATTVLVGATEQLAATVQPLLAADSNVSWQSSAPSVASVSTLGQVTGLSAGSATITVTSRDGSKTATCVVTVAAGAVAVTSVGLTKTTTQIEEGTVEQLFPIFVPSGATNQVVTWSSSDPTKASVSATGLVTAVAVGTSTITATSVDGGISSTCSVTVTALVVNGSLSLGLAARGIASESIVLSGYKSNLALGANMYPSASFVNRYQYVDGWTTNGFDTTDSNQWYLNGQAIPGATTDVLGSFGSALAAGNYNLAFVTYSSTRKKTGSAEIQFTVGASPSARFAKVAAGQYHSLALRSDGSLWGFGGGPALDTVISSSYLRPIQLMTFVKDIAAGTRHSLVLKTDGSLWVFGDNTFGQLGDGTLTARKTPLQIMMGVQAIAAGSRHSLALKTDGSLWTFGSNGVGQLGDGTLVAKKSPIQVMTGVVAVAAGESDSFAIKADGSLWAFGDNSYGQLGDPAKEKWEQPTPFQVMTGVRSIAAGGGAPYAHSIAMKTDGSLWAFGWNGYGQLGDGTTLQRNTPVQIATGAQALAAGSNFTFVIKSDGSLWSTGMNDYGQLGNGTSDTGTANSSLVQVDVGFTAVSAGIKHVLAIKVDGSLWAAGKNDYGQLGNGTQDSVAHPTLVQVALP